MNIKNQSELVNKLHNRHLAKLITALKEVNAPSIIIDAVKKQLSFYTNDIKNQVLLSNIVNYEQQHTKR